MCLRTVPEFVVVTVLFISLWEVERTGFIVESFPPYVFMLRVF